MFTIPAISLIIRELQLFFDFSWRDWSVTIIPGSIIAAHEISWGLQFSTTANKYIFLIAWLTFYVYLFNLCNQIIGVEEDKLNKPDRPIPSEKLSVQGAKVRCLATFFIFIGVSIYYPIVFPEAVIWILCIALLCMPAGKHWFVKNTVTMTAGTVSLLNASCKIMTSPTSKSETWVYYTAIWAGMLAHIQDLRDIRGDAIVGRKTMPLAFGNWKTRLIIVFVFIPVSLYVLHLGHIFRISPSILIALHIILAYRVLQMRDARYDHKTYMFYTYIFCFIIAIISSEGVDIADVMVIFSTSYPQNSTSMYY